MKSAIIKTSRSKKTAQKLFFFFSILPLLFVSSSCRSSSPATRGENIDEQQQEEQQPDQKTSSFSITPPNVNLAKPLEISTRADDAALCVNINRTIEESPYAGARWGIFVLSMKDGRIVCSRDGRQLFNPASIQKTLTAIVALDRLGADFRFKTSVLAANQPDADGNLNGDLILYGTGAPDFDNEQLIDLVNQLQAKGLKHVKGNVVGDASYFKGEGIGDGWTWNDLQWYYGAEGSALSFRENQAAIFMNENGKPAATTDFVQIRGELKPVESGHVEAFGAERGLESNEIYVWGNGNKAYGRISVHNPALWAAKTLKESLQQKGIIIDGDVKSVDWKTENRAVVASLNELADVQSKPLGELVQRMNKHSVNLYGELLLRILGKKFGAEAPDESREIQELRGDDSAGAAVVKKWLKEKNVVVDDIQIHDGSGLSRLDFVTPEAFGRAFVYAAKSNFGQVFADSLPIAGTDGTLGGRLGNVKGKILAKTGTITFVNSLTGFAQATDDEIYAFAIIANNVTRKPDATRVVDKIAVSLVNVGAPEKTAGDKQ